MSYLVVTLMRFGRADSALGRFRVRIPSAILASTLSASIEDGRRGHPWLVVRSLWEELLAMKSPQSPRDFFNAHSTEIDYIEVDTPSVIEDLDTPEDYLKFKP